MNKKAYGLGDLVELKKPHPCGANAWRIIRMGMDIRIKCTGCDHSVLIPRSHFEKRLKKILEKGEGMDVDQNAR
ncbi:DUF951 domain-containing protein [Thermicanus aegyptius]|uniref:DUF951 domain-containing protein n=1 Tax=Thermicanus aegyptius TaxID=94009 RepID=UPI00041EEC16|nr:DUF951 domain-containing protein [Thermicanus aegyptius]